MRHSKFKATRLSLREIIIGQEEEEEEEEEEVVSVEHKPSPGTRRCQFRTIGEDTGILNQSQSQSTSPTTSPP